MAVGETLRMLKELALLHKHFQTYFSVVPAVSADLVAASQRIRYEVYCEDLKWEPPRADRLEQDVYDDHSLHCLLKSVQNNKFIGTVRLILPSGTGLDHHLPFQYACGDGLVEGHPDPLALANREVAEVSRLAILPDYRRRQDEQKSVVGIPADGTLISDRRKFPYILVGLYLGMIQMASLSGIKTLYMPAEPALARHLSKLGGKMVPVGSRVKQRGLMIPYCLDVPEVISGASLVLRPLIRTIRKEIAAQLAIVESGDNQAVIH